MLALASSDAGNWKMDIRETDVDSLLIETWEQFSESARKKNIRLNLDIEDHYPNSIFRNHILGGRDHGVGIAFAVTFRI